MARILIVEDEKDIVDLLRFNLKQAGHDPLIATMAEEAIAGSSRVRHVRLIHPSAPFLTRSIR